MSDPTRPPDPYRQEPPHHQHGAPVPGSRPPPAGPSQPGLAPHGDPAGYRVPAVPSAPGHGPGGAPAPGPPIPPYSGPAHIDPGRLASFGGVLRPRRGQLVARLFGLVGAVVLSVMFAIAGWGIVMTLAMGAMVVFGLVMFATSWWRVRFEVRGHQVYYYPPLGPMRTLDTATVAEVVHLHLRSPGSKITEWITLLADQQGNRLLGLGTPMWTPADLEPVLTPFVAAGATPTVFDYPLKVKELPPRYFHMLPWSRRNVGSLVAIIVAVTVVLAVISVIVG